MAKMYHEDIEDYEEATEGEKRVFRFLREAARPGPNIGWLSHSLSKRNSVTITSGS